MSQPRIGLLRAIFRYIRYWNWDVARGIAEAAESRFTGSVEGIARGFDITRDEWVADYKETRKAVAELGAVLKDKEQRLADLNAKEEKLIELRNGALVKARETQNTPEYEKWAQAYERYDSQIVEIDAKQADLVKSIEESKQKFEKHLLRLSEMQGEIEKLGEQKAETMAEFVAAKKEIELNDRLGDLTTTWDRGPLDAIMRKTKQLSAEAEISSRLSGTDTKLQETELLAASRSSASRTKLNSILAAEKAETASKDAGTADTKVAEKTGRPQI